MISFLNGFILPALFAASIPIILHFLSKKKARKIPFSSLKFLKVIENQRIKRVKLFQILLIVARTLFIVFLVLAFSRPTISSYAGGTSNAQTTAVILLDDSYSMQSFAYSKTYFELANEKVSNLLNSFTNDDHVFLYTGSLENPVSINKNNLPSALIKLAAGNAVFNFNKSLALADSVFKQNINLNNELYFISDFKIHNSATDTTSFSNINNFHAYKILVAENIPFKNISIDTVVVESQLYELNKPFNISVKLTNHDQEAVETNLNLFNGDERVSMEYASLEAGETKTFKIKYIPKSEGIHFLKLKLDEDDLSFDNNWYFSFYMREEIKTLFISDNTSQALQTALKVLTENTIFQIIPARYNEWVGTNIINYDLIVLNDYKRMDLNGLSKLKAYAKLNRSIVIIPGESASIEDYNSFFNSIVSKSMFSLLLDSKNLGYYSLENQKTANDIFNSLFRDKRSSFTAPKIYKYFKQANYDHGLIHLSNNDPFITQTSSVVLFSSSLNQDWSDIEVNGLYLPLLYRSFYHAAQNKKPISDMLEIGNNITFNVQGATIDKDYFIQLPDGKNFSVIPKPVNSNLVFDGGLGNHNGFYILTDESGPMSSKAINHSAKELKKPFLNEKDLAFEMSSLNNEDFIEQIQNTRLGFELWIICIVLAFIMLITEMVLIKIIEGTPFLRKA